MPQDKRYRSGSAAAGGGMLTLWLTMRANAWLRQEWLSLLTETAAEGIGLVLQFLMLGIPLVVTIELHCEKDKTAAYGWCLPGWRYYWGLTILPCYCKIC